MRITCYMAFRSIITGERSFRRLFEIKVITLAKGGIAMPGYVIGNFFVYSIINAFTPGPGNILALIRSPIMGGKRERPCFAVFFPDIMSCS